jgi:hypothetical protein
MFNHFYNKNFKSEEKQEKWKDREWGRRVKAPQTSSKASPIPRLGQDIPR